MDSASSCNHPGASSDLNIQESCTQESFPSTASITYFTFSTFLPCTCSAVPGSEPIIQSETTSSISQMPCKLFKGKRFPITTIRKQGFEPCIIKQETGTGLSAGESVCQICDVSEQRDFHHVSRFHHRAWKTLFSPVSSCQCFMCHNRSGCSLQISSETWSISCCMHADVFNRRQIGADPAISVHHYYVMSYWQEKK